jgi:hypothetical protein
MRDDERLVLMPILARGYHVHPRAGGCFTEVAATLSTHRWTDHPGCLPPVLGRLARGVNDRTSAGARISLGPLIPWAVFPLRPAGDLTGDVAVTEVLVERAVRGHVSGPDVEGLLRRLDRLPRPRHVLDRITWRRAARRLANAELNAISAEPGDTSRDDRLREMLVAAIDAARAANGLPAMPQPMEVSRDRPYLLPVLTHLARVDEVLELRVEPVLDRWPAWLRDPWRAHMSEMSA